MSKKEVYEQKTEEILLPIVEEYGFELVDVEYVKEGGTWYLRTYIDKEGGISIDDCEKVSRRLSDILDEKDYIMILISTSLPRLRLKSFSFLSGLPSPGELTSII